MGDCGIAGWEATSCFTTGIPLRKPVVLRILSLCIEGKKSLRIGYVNFTLKQRARQAEHCYPPAASARHSVHSET